MSRIKAKNTRPEIAVRRALFASGFRFRIHSKDLPGKPDIVLKKFKCAIFVHGCFWHGHDCRKGTTLPKSNKEKWIAKLNSNKQRDQINEESLRRQGWHVFIIWECELTDSICRLQQFLERQRACASAKIVSTTFAAD
nr:very short patch repair endonuclease [Endobacterium cereale]